MFFHNKILAHYKASILLFCADTIMIYFTYRFIGSLHALIFFKNGETLVKTDTASTRRNLYINKELIVLLCSPINHRLLADQIS